MLSNRGFGQRGNGVFVIQDRDVVLLEFNEFLRRIGRGEITAETMIVSGVFTDGVRKLAGSLRLYEMIHSGSVRTDDLPVNSPSGILASGAAARKLLHRLEGTAVPTNGEAETLLRAVAQPVATLFTGELLRSPATNLAESSKDLLRPDTSENR